MRGRKTLLSLFSFLVHVSLKCSYLTSNGEFTPANNYLNNCGSPETILLDDGRTFKCEPQSASYLSTD